MLFVSGSLWITGIKFGAQFIHIATREKWFISNGLGENWGRLETTPKDELGKSRFWIMGIAGINLVFALLSLLLGKKFSAYPPWDECIEKFCMTCRIKSVENIWPESPPLSTIIHRLDSVSLIYGWDCSALTYGRWSKYRTPGFG